MTSASGKGSNGAGNGNGHSDDFEPFIRDSEEGFADPWNDPDWENPRAGYDPYEDYAQSTAGSRQQRGFVDRGLVDAIVGIIDSLGGVAGDSLSPDTRRRLQQALRDLLLVLRDVIDAMIRRLETKLGDDVEIENIPID